MAYISDFGNSAVDIIATPFIILCPKIDPAPQLTNETDVRYSVLLWCQGHWQTVLYHSCCFEGYLLQSVIPPEASPSPEPIVCW